MRTPYEFNHVSPRFESRISQLTIKKIESKDKRELWIWKEVGRTNFLLSGPDVFSDPYDHVVQVGSSFIITLLINKPPIDLLSKRSDYVKEEELHLLGFVWKRRHTDLLTY